MIRDLTEADVQFIFEAQEEDISPFDQFDDHRTAAKVLFDLENGNGAAWFCAKVTAVWHGWTGVAHLGCCSYNSFADFLADPYYADMKREALNDLNDVLAADYNTLNVLNALEV